MGRSIDLTGRTFGRLTVVERAGSNPFGYATWQCRCQCGNTCVVVGSRLTAGTVKSCGCLRHEGILKYEMRERDMLSASPSYCRIQQDAANPYQNLANAIVAVAADDYRAALKNQDAHLLKNLEQFFYSDWYKILTRVSPDLLIDRLKKENYSAAERADLQFAGAEQYNGGYEQAVF